MTALTILPIISTTAFYAVALLLPSKPCRGTQRVPGRDYR